jgi:hypothetical protein
MHTVKNGQPERGPDGPCTRSGLASHVQRKSHAKRRAWREAAAWRTRDALPSRSESASKLLVIPNVAHFIWYGDALPWVHRVAVRSAARVGQFARVVLHHEPSLGSKELAELREVAGFEARAIEPRPLFEQAGVDPNSLQQLYGRLAQPAARANLLRAAILAGQGGVYLDMDTICVASFAPLLAAQVFCGSERVVFPADLLRHGSLSAVARAYGLTLLRDVLRLLPDGYRAFKHVEGLYALAANNAVLGAQPNHPFMLALLDGMLRMPPERQLRRYALGTHLLQETIGQFRGAGLIVHPPEVFYPLGPEISQHWFRIRRHVELSSVLTPQARLVHWYASVRTRRLVPRIDPAYVKRYEHRQLLSALLAPYA